MLNGAEYPKVHHSIKFPQSGNVKSNPDSTTTPGTVLAFNLDCFAVH